MTVAPSNAALAKLHDFYQPPPPAWTPQTIGWYVLFALIAIFLAWLSVHLIRRRMANRYRREALFQLAATSPDQFSVVLKRTALAAWPRDKVASLSGEAWLKFLGQTSAMSAFQNTPGNRIEDLSLRSVPLSTDEEQTLRDLAEQWIRRHRVQT